MTTLEIERIFFPSHVTTPPMYIVVYHKIDIINTCFFTAKLSSKSFGFFDAGGASSSSPNPKTRFIFPSLVI